MTDYSNDAFLSHNGADKPAVERIAATLEKQGVKCFLDKWDIFPGDQWMRNLENELSGSRTILIFLAQTASARSNKPKLMPHCGGKFSNVSTASFRCCCRARRPNTSRNVRCFCKAPTP